MLLLPTRTHIVVFNHMAYGLFSVHMACFQCNMFFHHMAWLVFSVICSFHHMALLVSNLTWVFSSHGMACFQCNMFLSHGIAFFQFNMFFYHMALLVSSCCNLSDDTQIPFCKYIKNPQHDFIQSVYPLF